MTTPTPHLLHPKYRPDIDGLRAVAVLSVVAFHAFPTWMKGGFIGVDVFFVISGFLISTIIFENLDRGTFSFAEFYARRIKRIFPALLLVLIASFAFGWFALLADEYKQLGKHIAAGAGFVSNLVLWREADYFDNSAETKPLLHLWSLGIEEQFYIVWPFVLWFAWKRKFNLFTLTVIAALISFSLNLKGIKQDSVATFYSPQTRFWELLSGSVSAWLAIYKKKVFLRYTLKIDSWLSKVFYRKPIEAEGNHLSNLIGIVGSLLLVYGFFRITKEVVFPGKWAVIPVAGAILIILAGPKAWVNRNILSNKLAVWFGLISFPLYLWHWPLLSFSRIIESETASRNIRITAIALSIALAWLTFKLVERPIRLGKGFKYEVNALVALMAVVGYIGYNTYENDGLGFRVREFDLKNGYLISQLKTPPSLLKNDSCEEIFVKFPAGLCLLKERSLPEVLLIGDSHALQYYHGLVASMSKNVGILGAGWGGDYGGALNPLLGSCAGVDSINCKRQNVIYEYIRKNDNIKTVVVSFIHNHMNGDHSENHLRETLRFLISLKKNIVFSIDIPALPFDPKLCLNARPLRIHSKVKMPCGYEKADYLKRSKKYREKVFSVLAEFPSVKVFDPSIYMCDSAFCYAEKNGSVLYRNEGDNPHLSDDGSMFVAPYLKAIIEN